MHYYLELSENTESLAPPPTPEWEWEQDPQHIHAAFRCVRSCFTTPRTSLKTCFITSQQKSDNGSLIIDLPHSSRSIQTTLLANSLSSSSVSSDHIRYISASVSLLWLRTSETLMTLILSSPHLTHQPHPPLQLQGLSRSFPGLVINSSGLEFPLYRDRPK